MISDDNQQLSAEDLREIEECEKIVRFWEEVMGGRHPRIKIPPHLVSFFLMFLLEYSTVLCFILWYG